MMRTPPRFTLTDPPLPYPTLFRLALPHLPAAEVPDGEDEAGNVELARWGTLRDFDFQPQEHADFAPALGLDFETAAKMSGARFAFLKEGMARLERALG